MSDAEKKQNSVVSAPVNLPAGSTAEALPKETSSKTAVEKKAVAGEEIPSSEELFGKKVPKEVHVTAKAVHPDGKTVKKKKSGAVYLSGVSPDKIEFSIRHLSLMLRTGMNLLDALTVIIDQTSDDRLKSAYEEVAVDVQQGEGLAAAMKKHPKIFSDIIVSIIQVSEETGSLEKNLLYLADYLKKNYELQGKVRGALIYPLIVLGLTVGEMLGVVFFILPKLEVMFASFDNIPAFSLMVVKIARLFRENVAVVSIVGVVLFFLFTRFLKTKVGQRFSSKVAISFPIIKKLNRTNILAGFCRTLGMLLETSIPISTALEITAQSTGNHYFAEAIFAVSKEVKGGKNLADSLLAYRSFFPISLIRIIEAGEKTGTLEDNLSYMYGSYSSDVEEMADNMVTMIEPLLLIFAGAMIGLLAITIIAPVYQFTSNIN